MSWSTSTHEPVAKSAIVLAEPYLADTVAAESRHQYAAAVEAAKALAEVVGRVDDLVYINLTGHANPDHAPRDGWADETITITVSAAPQRVR